MNFVADEISIPIFIELSCDVDGCVSCVRFRAYGFLGLLALVTWEGDAVVKECMSSDWVGIEVVDS